MNHNGESPTWSPWKGDLRNLEAAAFAALGNDAIAYLKPVIADGKPGVAVHAADGRMLALLHEPLEVAVAVVRQNDLEPVSLH